MPVTSAAPSTTVGPKQLSDGNSQGTILGKSATDLIGFFGGTGVNAQTGTAEGVVQPVSQGSLRGNNGVITVYAITVTATSVAPNTTAEQTFTVTGLATTSAVAVIKPTVDAGIAIVGARCSSTNNVGIAFANDTAATITPTAGQTYYVMAVPSALVLTASLSPAAVAPNTMVEQQFTVTGLPSSAAVIVSKPTVDAGVGIVDARVVSAGVVGITFANFTAATVTPTASQTYNIFAAREVQIAPIYKTVSLAVTPVSVAANTTAEQSFVLTGLPANAQVVVNKPSLTTGLGLGGARVSAANTLAVCYINNTSAAITPPAETYLVGVFPAAGPAAASSNAYNAQFGGTDHAAMVSLGLVAGP